MNTRNILVSGLLASIVMCLLAGLAHELVFAQFFADATDAEHEGTAIIFVAYLVLGLMMSYLYTITNKTRSAVVEGLTLGVFVGVLWIFPHGLAMAGAHGDSIAYVFINTAWHIVEQGTGGMVIGAVFQKRQA